MKRLLIVCLILLPAGCKGEPTFQGRSRSYWMQELKSKWSTGRMRAAEALGHLAPQAKQAVPDLIHLLGDEDHLVRWAAANALGKFGPDAADAVPALRELTNHSEVAVADAASWALQQIGSEATPRKAKGSKQF
jgi:HEAT repeat protein